MGQFFDEIPDFLVKWIEQQAMFWVASAPLATDGHVNVSPKGLAGSFHVLNPNKVWYEDCTGSGIETIAHLRENGRITILFHAFEGPARIARLFGTGTVHEFGTPEYENLLPNGTRKVGSRAAIVVDVHKVGTSCGYAVPLYTFKRHRTRLNDFAEMKEALDEADGPPPAKNGLKSYWATSNARSIDGLPGMRDAFKSPVKFQRSVRQKETNGLVARLYSLLEGKGGELFDVRFIISFVAGVVLSSLYFKFTSR